MKIPEKGLPKEKILKILQNYKGQDLDRLSRNQCGNNQRQKRRSHGGRLGGFKLYG